MQRSLKSGGRRKRGSARAHKSRKRAAPRSQRLRREKKEVVKVQAQPAGVHAEAEGRSQAFEEEIASNCYF